MGNSAAQFLWTLRIEWWVIFDERSRVNSNERSRLMSKDRDTTAILNTCAHAINAILVRPLPDAILFNFFTSIILTSV